MRDFIEKSTEPKIFPLIKKLEELESALKYNPKTLAGKTLFFMVTKLIFEFKETIMLLITRLFVILKPAIVTFEILLAKIISGTLAGNPFCFDEKAPGPNRVMLLVIF